MHLSIQTWMRREPIERSIERAARHGYESVELAGEPDVYDVKNVRQQLSDAGMRCWGILARMEGERNLATPDKMQRVESVRYVEDCIRLAAEMGGHIVSLAPVTLGKLVPEASPEEEWQFLVNSMRQLYEYALEMNIVLALAPVNRYETYLLNRCEQALVLAQAVGPRCGICLDTFHMNLEEENPLAAIRLAGERLADFHVADSNRLACGMGIIDWKAIVSTLGEIHYEGALTVEFVPRHNLVPASAYASVELPTISGQKNPASRLIDPRQNDEAVYEFLVQESAAFLWSLIDSEGV